MKKDEQHKGLERRDFLRGLGIAAGGVAAVAPVVGQAAEAKSETPEEQVKSRYQETDHVKRFYALNRL